LGVSQDKIAKSREKAGFFVRTYALSVIQGEMVKFSINLPTKYRLHLQIVKKRRNLDDIPLTPSLGKILRIRNGSKISRYFRHIFENSKIKRLLGANLAALLIANSFIPHSSPNAYEFEANTISAPIVLETKSGIQFPVANIKITQGYNFFHPGIDLDGVTGDDIRSISAGYVEKIEYSKFGYGNSILINHGNEIKSLYAHLYKIDVEKGYEVTKETRLGEMGATGRARGDHLHLEIYENGKTINPLLFLTSK